MLKKGLLILCLLLSSCGKISPTGSSGSTFDTSGKNQISTEVGAGGSGVYCPGKNGARPYFEVLDVYEARKRGMGVDLGGPNLSVDQKLDIAFARLARLSPLRAKRYQKRAHEILKEAYFFHSGYLPHIGDEDPADLAAGCKLLQIATRRKPIFENDPEFIIDWNLFNQLDSDNQTVLLGHETSYDEAGNDYGQTTSRMARGFNSLYFSKRIESMTMKDFFAFLDKIGFLNTDVGGITVPTWSAARDELWGSNSMTFAEDGHLASMSWMAKGKPAFDYFGTSLQIADYSNRSSATFSKDGHLSQIDGQLSTVKNEEELNDRGNSVLLGVEARRGFWRTTFYEDGHFHMLLVDEGSKLKALNSNELTVLEEPKCVVFDPAGFVEALKDIHQCAAR